MTKHGTHASVRAAMVRYDNHGNHTLKINSTIHYMAITKTHLKKCLRKACLGTNNEHTMIAYTCCDNRHKFIIDMEIGQRDIDKHIHKICFEKKPLRCTNKTDLVDPFFGGNNTTAGIKIFNEDI